MPQTHTNVTIDGPVTTHDTILEFARMIDDFTWALYIDATFEGDHRGNDVEARLESVFESLADEQRASLRVIHSTETDLSGLRHAQVLIGGVSALSADDVALAFRRCDFDEVYIERFDPKRASRYFQPYLPEQSGPDSQWHFQFFWPRTANSKPRSSIRRLAKRPPRSRRS